MDHKIEYFNDLMARHEELFFHELSDCCGWKTEFIGIDFIQSQDIQGKNRDEIIKACMQAITAAGLAEEIAFAVAGKDILLRLKVKGCIHMGKEVKLKERGIKVYNCIIANMIHDQLIEKLGYETTYTALINVDEKEGCCEIQSAIFESKEKIGCVSDWVEECKRIDEEDSWVRVSA
jgi:hypothetical protein